ncbi:amidohydrolase family protein [Paracoccus sp. Z330]|uniref:Amidohydrolase family protein n=1 Tax=Paracoccus onchidii TaxID=3017813 RepID=A0ABT4ZEA5_9RHOB|nr:amidohydrolase family protein [Paracoccus onchidii]MDB6177688.1 amidohydrolase family protein [Paracoccus onchidii]
MKVDSHQHYWQIDRGDYRWMDDDVAAIRRDFGPRDLAPLRKTAGIDGTVVVQAADSIEETSFLLDLAARTPSIMGVVGWVDLADDSAIHHVHHFAQDPLFKGVRPMLQDIASTDWILQPQVLNNLEQVARMGLRLDALVTPRHLPVIAELARRLAHLPIVIDHCAKPEFLTPFGTVSAAWHDGIAEISRHPMTMCKLSGLATEFGTGWSSRNLATVAGHVLDCFGPSRVMWGSDWPVLNLQGSYQDWYECAQQLTAHLDADQRDDLFGGTAIRFYGLTPPSPAQRT